MLERMGAVLALLTILPVSRRGAGLGDAASALYAFPLAGLAVGAIAGGLGAGLLAAGLEPLLAAVVTVASLAVLTGMHHIDGLADTADALMARGGRQRRLEVLKEPSVGAAGAAAVAISLMATAGAVYGLDALTMIGAVVSAEIIAKVSMVAAMRYGTADPASSAAPFVASARSSKSVAVAGVLGIAIVLAVSGAAALGALLAGVIAALIVARMTSRALGSLRGDALGAVNEISRIAALIVLVGFA